MSVPEAKILMAHSDCYRDQDDAIGIFQLLLADIKFVVKFAGRLLTGLQTA